MRTVEDLLQQATADLNKAQQREARAREQLDAAIADRGRLEAFLSVLAGYTQQGAAQHGDASANAKGSRYSRHGTVAIEQIKRCGAPMQIDPLADAVEATGLEISGGEKRNSYLASYLSKDPRLEFIRGRGWWARELGPVPSVGPDLPLEITEPSDENSSEGSGEAGSGEPVSFVDLQRYRTGGGGT